MYRRLLCGHIRKRTSKICVCVCVLVGFGENNVKQCFAQAVWLEMTCWLGVYLCNTLDVIHHYSCLPFVVSYCFFDSCVCRDNLYALYRVFSKHQTNLVFFLYIKTYSAILLFKYSFRIQLSMYRLCHWIYFAHPANHSVFLHSVLTFPATRHTIGPDRRRQVLWDESLEADSVVSQLQLFVQRRIDLGRRRTGIGHAGGRLQPFVAPIRSKNAGVIVAIRFVGGCNGGNLKTKITTRWFDASGL